MIDSFISIIRITLQGTSDHIGDDPNEMGDNIVAVDLAGASVISIAAGCDFTCAIVDGGSVMCWYVERINRFPPEFC